jgi:hypothetical protein
MCFVTYYLQFQEGKRGKYIGRILQTKNVNENQNYVWRSQRITYFIFFILGLHNNAFASLGYVMPNDRVFSKLFIGNHV